MARVHRTSLLGKPCQEGYTSTVYYKKPTGGYTLVAYQVSHRPPHAKSSLTLAAFADLFRERHAQAKAHTTDLGARLTALRKAAGYTQVELAAELGNHAGIDRVL